ncbi:hypothetical protein U0070_002016 [Myodes glareolus]|uniref:PSMD12/CSN4-like N-terminal domain-containing protein n=1 Tax=Myodes glareolus TaxID=447135 RepID=A0AAW0J7Y0_MYOGA
MADGGSERADGRIVKMEVDYSATVDQRLPECEKLAKEGRLQEVIETLLSLEKQTRTQCCTYVEEITDLPVKLRLIDTLRMVTEGKIYVEIERARLTKTLATIKEQNGDVKEAASILQELQVRGFREHVNFMLSWQYFLVEVADFNASLLFAKLPRVSMHTAQCVLWALGN